MSETTTIKLFDETAAFVTATGNLLAAFKSALVALEPAMGPMLDGRPLRITYGTDERMLLVAVVDDHGQSMPFMGIHGNPTDADAFGEVGVPVIVSGMYAQHTVSH